MHILEEVVEFFIVYLEERTVYCHVEALDRNLFEQILNTPRNYSSLLTDRIKGISCELGLRIYHFEIVSLNTH